MKDKNNRKSDLIAKSEVAEHQDDYASQVKAMTQTVDVVIEEDDGIYAESARITKVKRRISGENQTLLQAAIEKSHYKEIDGKTYIRILENSDER